MPCNDIQPAGPSVRQRIVDAVAAVLSTVPALAGRVYVFAPSPFHKDSLPAINLRDTKETDEGKCGNCSKKLIEFTADLEVAEQAGSDWYIRQWAQDAQSALLRNPTLYGLAEETRLVRSEIAIGQTGFVAGGIRITFTVRYGVKLS